ncbi:MFS transporter [Pedobacter yonginense]|uniref:MFS transporter n=1 Tax=Pedobacter yonginense TaxID=651869 RepID=A0A317EPR3_9SPHI|nr:MFS transporter [Pedobacter yonginense]PWS28851.1 MFS transporter [Pedobacter yonginense]
MIAAPANKVDQVSSAIKLNFGSIIAMNLGFFGIQYSFGLQQTNMTPIYSYLGANADQIPLLNLAGPMTGLIIQPIIGAMSDKTTSKFGRRRPYFLIGAIICSICLFLMPYSSSIWMAAGILWILDAGNNITMEPYRAFVSDKLPSEQHSLGFLTQSFFTGLGITLANLTPGILIAAGLISIHSRSGNNIPYTTYAAFFIGGVVSIGSIMFSCLKTKEAPLSKEEIVKIKAEKGGIGIVFKDIFEAFKVMPSTMRKLGVVYLFNWYAMFVYWQFITLCLAKTLYNTTDSTSDGFASAQLLTGTVNGGYNVVTFLVAFPLAFFARKITAQKVHLVSLIFGGACLALLPFINNPALLVIPIIGLGIAWASMMGTPYAMLAGSIPKAKTGIFMGILNMFIVIPMLLETITFKYVYKYLLGHNPENAIIFAGSLIAIAGFMVLLINKKDSAEVV